MNFIQIANNLKSYYLNNLNDSWNNSTNEWIKKLSTCKKGSVGEDIIKTYYILNDSKVEKRTSVEIDTIIDNVKYEIKLSCLNKSGYFKWLQIRLDDDYDFLYLISIYPNDIKVYKLSKELIIQLTNNGIIKNQHGGKRNKDYKIKYLGIKSINLPEWLLKCEVEAKNNLI